MHPLNGLGEFEGSAFETLTTGIEKSKVGALVSVTDGLGEFEVGVPSSLTNGLRESECAIVKSSGLLSIAPPTSASFFFVKILNPSSFIPSKLATLEISL